MYCSNPHQASLLIFYQECSPGGEVLNTDCIWQANNCHYSNSIVIMCRDFGYVSVVDLILGDS